MNSIIFAISLMLKIGVGGNILQSMCEQNGKYIEKHIGSSVVMSFGGQSILYGHDDAVSWFAAIPQRSEVLNIKVERVTRKSGNWGKWSHVILIKVKDGVMVYDIPVLVETHKGRILRLKR